MESNKMSDLFDNNHIMNFQEAVDLIKLYFLKELPYFVLKEEYIENFGYWGIKYVFDEVFVSITCDRGGIETYLIIDGKEYPLWQFDSRIKIIEVASKKNILFILNVIKIFFMQ